VLAFRAIIDAERVDLWQLPLPEEETDKLGLVAGLASETDLSSKAASVVRRLPDRRRLRGGIAIR